MGRRISTKSVYEKKKYYALGLPMTFYWALPKLGYLDEAPVKKRTSPISGIGPLSNYAKTYGKCRSRGTFLSPP